MTDKCAYPHCRRQLDDDVVCTSHPPCKFPGCTDFVRAIPKGLLYCPMHAMLDDTKCPFPRCLLKKDPSGDCIRHPRCKAQGCLHHVRARPHNLIYCDEHGHLRERRAIVYEIVNPQSGARYTGSSWDLESCLAKHRMNKTVGTTKFNVTIR